MVPWTLNAQTTEFTFKGDAGSGTNGSYDMQFRLFDDNGALDLGLVAEEVNRIEPLLSSYNDKGEVEGVKYDRIGVVLINAVKEQQAQIEIQRKQIEEQQKVIDGLRTLICNKKRQAEVCRRLRY
jgi:hypothetical protein